MRGFMTDFDAAPVVKNMKDHFRLYPLGSAPKEVNWVNTAMEDFNTLHAQDATFFEEVNITVQEEPNSAEDPEILGLLASIGIQKGKPFAPDARMKKILAEAAAVGTAAQRTILFRNRDENTVIWPGSKSWEIGFAGGSHEFLNDGVSLINSRTRFHFYATGITPVMVKPPVGAGSQYVIGLRDAEGQALDGSKTLSNPRAAQRPGQALLGHHGLRQPDPFPAADRQPLPGSHQHRQGHGAERRRFLRRLHRS